MNLRQTIEIYAGGPGSGPHPGSGDVSVAKVSAKFTGKSTIGVHQYMESHGFHLSNPGPTDKSGLLREGSAKETRLGIWKFKKDDKEIAFKWEQKLTKAGYHKSAKIIEVL